jgi:hypothetical protein
LLEPQLVNVRRGFKEIILKMWSGWNWLGIEFIDELL